MCQFGNVSDARVVVFWGQFYDVSLEEASQRPSYFSLILTVIVTDDGWIQLKLVLS
jgi:hypothetical protein